MTQEHAELLCTYSRCLFCSTCQPVRAAFYGYVTGACQCEGGRVTSSVMESRDDVASSYRRMGGFFRMARAMATRCFSPPEMNCINIKVRTESVGLQK